MPLGVSNSALDTARWAIGIGAFLVMISAWIVALLGWHLRRRKLANKVLQRLGLIPGEGNGSTRTLRIWHEGKEATIVVPRMPQQSGPLGRIEQMRLQAGWRTPAIALLPMAAGIGAGAFLLVFATTGRLLGGVCGLIAVLLVLWAYLRRCVNRRENLFDLQFVDAMELATRSLRAGHPLVGAFQLVSEEIGDPVGPVFGEICQQQAMGLSLEDAIHIVGSRSPSEDMHLFATSVVIQMRSGGNLADMMERLSLVIRDRIRLSRRVRILTAQTQFGKRILVALPFVLLAVLSILNPRYMDLLYSTTPGQLLLCGAGVSVLLGMWMMNRMIRLRY
ncbi:MAG: type II secretion system F family protein [Planctomycetaceae bacterium]|nr:type II secretion system F family protein [Planctomycetaceae bacterium]